MKKKPPELLDMFYPSDPDGLRSVASRTGYCHDLPALPAIQNLPAAILVPHGAYQSVLPVVRQIFNTVSDLQPRHIVLLASLHREILAEDTGSFLFLPMWEFFETPLGDLPVDTTTRDRLVASFPPVPQAITLRNSYFLEENCFEPLFPLIQMFFPAIPVLPILGAWQNGIQDQYAVSALRSLLHMDTHTLFITVSNISDYTACDQAVGQAYASVGFLANGDLDRKLPSGSPHGMCSSSWVRAIDTLAGGTTGNWHTGWVCSSGRVAAPSLEKVLEKDPIKPIIQETWCIGAMKEWR